MVDHTDFVQSARVHECKQILDAGTSDAGKVITPSSTSNGEGELRRLTLDEVDTEEANSPWTGWQSVVDGEYTSGSPLTLAGDTRTKVTIDGEDSDLDDLPDNVSSLWDVSNSTITPAEENDFYLVQVQFSCETEATDVHVTAELDVGGGDGVIVSDTKPLLVSEEEYRATFMWTVPASATFVSNGGEVYITASDSTDFWGFSINICRVHAGRQ